MDKKTRTLTQNNSMRLWATLCAKHLNEAGLERHQYIELIKEHGLETPWTQDVFVEDVWRLIQEAMTKKVSTTEPTTVEYQEVYEAIHKYFAQKAGITLPAWPSRFYDSKKGN